MQDAEFLKMYNRSGIKMAIIGVFILALGLFMIWMSVSGADPEAKDIPIGGTIALWVFAIIFALVGLLMIWLPIKTSMNQKKGKDPITNAIQSGDSGFILWFYEYVAEVKSGAAKNTAHRIFMFSRDNKQYSMDVKKARVQDVLSYLQSKFPQAMMGYTPEMEAAYKARFK